MPEALNQEVYERLAKELDGMKLNIQKAEDLRDALVEVGEDTTAQDGKITKMKTLLGRWENVLRRRGFLDIT